MRGLFRNESASRSETIEEREYIVFIKYKLN